MTSATRVEDLLSIRAAATPAEVALMVHGGATLSYRAWHRRANALARGLVAQGVRPGDRVALLFDNRWWTDYAVSYVAVHRAGAVAVPLSPRFSGHELALVLDRDHSSVALVLCPSDLAGLVPPAHEGPVAQPENLEAGLGEEPFPTPAGADDLAEIIYTSGTTGSPRGVAVSHENLLVHDLPPQPQGGHASFLHAFPIGTNAGQECLRMPLRRTATAVVLASFDPERLCAAIAQQRIRRLQLVPSMAQLVVASRAPQRHDVSSVQRIILSSAPAPAALWEQLTTLFPGASLWNAYALTESGGARTMMAYDPARPQCVGLPVGKSEVRVVDESGADVPPGETGEVWLRRRAGPGRWYHRDPEATAAAFAGDWLRTGDLGHLDREGYLSLVDRKKDLIISGGLNIASLEVEHALYEHPGVAEAAVLGVPHEVLGQDVAAAVVLDAPTEAAELRSFVRERLGEHKVPRHVLFVDHLPRNASGKVLKRELHERFAARPATAPVAARDELEAAILAIWREVLELTDLGVHDDFFDLGGHSLAAARITARVRDAFALELPATAVFEHPTVAELAAAVGEARAGAPAR
jgi:acyl-CoA synthetase (AMP-forming)/AMP-acid ligase II/acyl carrier protein